MPGVGSKSAVRMAYHILSLSEDETNEIINAIKDAKTKIKYCSVCQNITEDDPCEICSNPRRDSSVLCVMDKPKDVIALEKTREYFGMYHVLHGSISPMDGIGPDDLKIKELIPILKKNSVFDEWMMRNRMEWEDYENDKWANKSS